MLDTCQLTIRFCLVQEETLICRKIIVFFFFMSLICQVTTHKNFEEQNGYVNSLRVSAGGKVPISTPYYIISPDPHGQVFQGLDMSFSTTV